MDANNFTGKWMLGGMAATAATCLMAVVTTDLKSSPTAVSAITPLGVAVVTSLMTLFILAQPNRYKIGRVTRIIPVLGVISGLAGILMLVSTVSAAAAVTLLALVIACVLVLTGAEDAARRAASKAVRE